MHVDHHDHPDGYRGWIRPGGRRGRWIDPFLLLLVAEGETHGYALIAALNDLCVAPEAVDVGMAYRALREFERNGLVESRWMVSNGPPRRAYRLTADGRRALAEWTAVMRERDRLISTYLDRAKRLGGTQGG
jgi:PadR family transcriptional regulator, regulatory protein PadR